MRKFLLLTLILWNLAVTGYVIFQNIEIERPELKMADELNVPQLELIEE